MENLILMFSSLLILLFFCFSQTNADAPATKTYIIQLRLPENTTIARRPEDLESWYRSFLPNTTDTSGGSRLIHQYSEAIIGFAANLTDDELKNVEAKEGFLKAYPDQVLSLLTTHTPTFLGLREGNGYWKGSDYGRGVIIGMLDSGIAPDHPSFNDKGMPPPPSKWKGACNFKNPDRCNKKVIGGQAFDGDKSEPPIDDHGHGTHTASTAAGNFVANATVLGNGNGTAVGLAPRAHLAIYKVCGTFGCTAAAVLAGMDAAIKDGVDIISMSLGGNIHDYSKDVIAIGAFSAMEKGVFVSCAAGNSGPESESLSNEAPWILTVGAGTMDRSIRVTVKLGDGQELDGESVFQPKNYTSEALPLVLPNGSGSPYQTNCITQAMNGTVDGKIVVCKRPEGGPRVEIGSMVKDSGGAGMILINDEHDGYTTLAEAHVLPASHISYNDGEKIFAYFKSSDKPTASFIFKGTILGDASAPIVASFSSRGPSVASRGVLKPDIISPGVSVLAGWPSDVETSQDQTDPTFNILSGTSMSTPHLSGIAALVKGMHPEWSPAAIKSAIMTTSNVACHDGKPIMNELHEPASYYEMGAGHVNPEKASDPGLVYDISADDYVGFLCGLGYYDKDVEAVTRRKVKCADITKVNQSQLNYPSITVYLRSGEKTVNRTVTNVGEGKEKYEVKLDVPKGVEVSVEPEVLEFDEVNEKKSFVVSFKKKEEGKDDFVEGDLKWVSAKHVVRSPIIVTKDF